MAREFRVFLLIYLFLCIFPGFSSANDGGPDVNYWIKDNKVACVSVFNPEQIIAGSFLLFDYSKDRGEMMGKPWVVVEKGKCYQIDSVESENPGRLLIVKEKQGKNIKYYSDHKRFSPREDVVLDNNVKIAWNRANYFVTVGENDLLHFTGIFAYSLFPTRYYFGYPVTTVTSYQDEEFEELFKDKDYIEAASVFYKLSRDIERTIQSCDNRKRVEYQLQISEKGNAIGLKHIVWRLNDNSNVLIPDPVNVETFNTPMTLSAIEAIGCRDKYIEFANDRRSEFLRFDEVVAVLLKRYPKLKDRTIIEREKTELSMLNSYLDNSYQPEPLAAIVAKSDSATFSDITYFENAPEVVNLVDENLFEDKVMLVETVVDEPTKEKKMQTVLGTRRVLFAYFTLPFLTITAFIFYVVAKRKIKR
jgi:hypothetical protein